MCVYIYIYIYIIILCCCNLHLHKPVLLPHMFPGGMLGLCWTAQFSFVIACPGWLLAYLVYLRAHLLAACSVVLSACLLAHLYWWSIDVIRAWAAVCRLSLKTHFMGLCAVQRSFENSRRIVLILVKAHCRSHINCGCCKNAVVLAQPSTRRLL